MTFRAIAPRELTVSLFVPPHNPATQLLEALAGVVRERSEGRLLLRLFPSEQRGSTARQYDLAQRGEVDIAYFMHGATGGRFPLTELAALPFVARDPVTGTDALLEAMPEFLAREHPGVKLLFVAANAPMAIHSIEPMRSLGDFRGKRIRHAGEVVAETLRALGAEPVNVMPLDVPAALASGRIHAAPMTYEAALVNRLADVSRHAFDLYANTVTFGLAMNAARYAALPDDLRAVVDDVLGPSAGRSLARMLAESVTEGRRYMAEAGVTIIAPDPLEATRIAEAVAPVAARVIDALDAKGLPASAVYALLARPRA